ncbi:acid phosphatase (class A) [Pseudoxanthomonas sp. GM95]|uniref:acid phosphatase n=1 Tax=Pseudoxanthomonas sp. GM95 TaxID=1881043 RepID=UPI0008C7B628|nr:phosphatase PAP2 family protein [Pseudoxanthomonas sp. GM95]SEM46926.1 acid phosphatase (class A) [Pseudoxanthomonas sp. GM95]
MPVVAGRLTLSCLLLALAGCIATPAPRAPTTATAEVSQAKAVGYLAKDALPDSLKLLPAPPAPGSAAFALDQAVMQQALALHDSPRLAQAHADADLSFPVGANQFACALGLDVTQAATPHLYHLLERSRIDVSAATRAAKDAYKRPRPFLSNQAPTCTPEDDQHLRSSGSYPSGHSAIGWAWALILGELDPARADALAVRGRNYGESRLVCNVHWNSDVSEGRVLASAVVARLHDDAGFRDDLAGARLELQQAQRQPHPVTSRDCASEAALLPIKPEDAR